jgi:hypothetical protein
MRARMPSASRQNRRARVVLPQDVLTLRAALFSNRSQWPHGCCTVSPSSSPHPRRLGTGDKFLIEENTSNSDFLDEGPL